MNIFQAAHEDENEMQLSEKYQGRLDTLDKLLKEMSRTIGQRRTLIKHAEKNLQEFQDSISAILMDDDLPKKQYSASNNKDTPQKSVKLD